MPGNPRQPVSAARSHPDSPPPAPAAKVGCLAAVARVYWMAIGNAMLFFCAMYAARLQAPSALDALYAGLVALLLVVRWLDITRLGGQTAEGEPATTAHWRRYALRLVPISAGVWWLIRFAHGRGWM